MKGTESGQQTKRKQKKGDEIRVIEKRREREGEREESGRKWVKASERTVWQCRGAGFFLLLFLELCAQPIQTFVETFARGGTSGLDVPMSLAERMQTKLVSNFGWGHGVG